MTREAPSLLPAGQRRGIGGTNWLRKAERCAACLGIAFFLALGIGALDPVLAVIAEALR